MPLDLKYLKKFYKHADAGDPDCLCSYCKRAIAEDKPVLRLWPKRKDYEYRLCEDCSKVIVPQTVAELAEAQKKASEKGGL